MTLELARRANNQSQNLASRSLNECNNRVDFAVQQQKIYNEAFAMVLSKIPN